MIQSVTKPKCNQCVYSNVVYKCECIIYYVFVMPANVLQIVANKTTFLSFPLLDSPCKISLVIFFVQFCWVVLDNSSFAEPFWYSVSFVCRTIEKHTLQLFLISIPLVFYCSKANDTQSCWAAMNWYIHIAYRMDDHKS